MSSLLRLVQQTSFFPSVDVLVTERHNGKRQWSLAIQNVVVHPSWIQHSTLDNFSWLWLRQAVLQSYRWKFYKPNSKNPLVAHGLPYAQAKQRTGCVSKPDPSSTIVRNSALKAVVLFGYSEKISIIQWAIFRARNVENMWKIELQSTQLWLFRFFKAFCLPYSYLSQLQLVDTANGIWTIGDILDRTSSLVTVLVLNVTENKHRRGDQRNKID